MKITVTTFQNKKSDEMKQQNKESIEQFVKEYTQLCLKYNVYINADRTYVEDKSTIYLDYEIQDHQFVNNLDEIRSHIKELIQYEDVDIRIILG